MDNLRPYQKEAVKQIVEFYNSEIKNAKISISTGLGVIKILAKSIEHILTANKNCKILLLCSHKALIHQYIIELMSCSNPLNIIQYLPDIKNNGIFMSDYFSILTQTDDFDYNQFDFIICNDLDFLDDNYIYPFFETSYKGKRLTLLSSDKETKLTQNDKLLFQYTLSNAIQDRDFTVLNEKDFIYDFFCSLLNNLKFTDIKFETKHKNFHIDVEANYNKRHYIFELKTYRTKYVSSRLIENAAYNFSGVVKNIELQDFNPVMIVTCEVDESLKKEIFDETKVEILDISNLLFLCGNSQTLMQKLSLYIPFPIFDIKPKKTLLYNNEQSIVTEPKYESQYQKFENLFSKCKPGKEDDDKYQKICTDIIKYLFETEFFKMSTQHKTGDHLFRMDMICSLKGTTEFWKFLMQFYNTKFVVFEYKNYTETISQNLVFITSKYLYPSALRNVAFIISRNGLDKNAETVVKSKIKNDKMLIVSLTDDDLLVMVALKDEGKEPSDYLMEKVENLLMSLSI